MGAKKKSNNKEITHSAFMDTLGGNKWIVDLIRESGRAPVTPHAVSMWRQRGRIPPEFRPLLAAVAESRGIELPPDFLGLGKWKAKRADKLTKADISFINADPRSSGELAPIFGVTDDHIRQIRSGQKGARSSAS